MCPHTPHWLRAASYVRSGHCSRVYALGCSRARCSCVVVTLARLGVTIFVSWLGVRCRAVTRPGLVRHFLHHPAAPLPLQSRWFIRACCSSGGSLEHAPVGKLFPNGHPDCSDEGAYTRTGGAPSTANRHSGAPRACPRAGKGRSRRSICPNVVASMPCAGKGPQALREYWSEGIGSLGSACPARATHHML